MRKLSTKQGVPFAEWEIGDWFETASRTVTEADIVNFAGVSGDFNPLHMDAVFAEKTVFGKRIAHGALVFAITTGLMNATEITKDEFIGFLEADVKWPRPVYIGDTIHIRAEAIEKKLSSKGGKGILKLRLDVMNQNDQQVGEQIWTFMLKA